MRMSLGAGASRDLASHLELVREMLSIRSTYGKLDAEQNGAAQVGLVAQHQANLTQARPGTSESSAIKRAFALVMASGDVSAAYSVAALSGLARATFDPKKNIEFSNTFSANC